METFPISELFDDEDESSNAMRMAQIATGEPQEGNRRIVLDTGDLDQLQDFLAIDKPSVGDAFQKE